MRGHFSWLRAFLLWYLGLPCQANFSVLFGFGDTKVLTLPLSLKIQDYEKDPAVQSSFQGKKRSTLNHTHPQRTNGATNGVTNGVTEVPTHGETNV